LAVDNDAMVVVLNVLYLCALSMSLTAFLSSSTAARQAAVTVAVNRIERRTRLSAIPIHPMQSTIVQAINSPGPRMGQAMFRYRRVGQQSRDAIRKL
jgi:hypothetical protein